MADAPAAQIMPEGYRHGGGPSAVALLALLDRWGEAQRASGNAERSITERRRLATRFSAASDPLTASADEVASFLGALPVNGHTRSTYGYYLREWLKWLVGERLRDDNPIAGVATVRRPAGRRDPRCRDPQFPTRWRQPIAEYAAHCRASGHSDGTIQHRLYVLAWIARSHPDPWMVSHRDLVTYLSNESWSAATRRSKSTTVRSFYGWADLECRNPRVNPAAKLGAVKVPRGRPRPTPAAVLQSALQRADARGRLMLMLGAHAGLRRSEIAKVHSRDAVEGMLRVTGKGGHTRVIPLSPDLAAAIASRGDGYLFPGKIDGHLSADAVANVVVDLLGGGWTAHTLRHAFATKAYAADRDLLAVQELLGHSSPQTTAVYAAVPSDAMHRAVLAAAG